MNEESDERQVKLPEAKAMELAGLVDYAEDSIVSRTLTDRDGGSVTAFAFDRGQNLSEHTTPFDALVYVIDGQAELTIGGRAVAVSEGQLALMPADVPHAVAAPRPFKMLLVMLR